MQIDLDENERFEIKWILEREIKDLENDSKSMLFTEYTRNDCKEKAEYLKGIVEKLKQNLSVFPPVLKCFYRIIFCLFDK